MQAKVNIWINRIKTMTNIGKLQQLRTSILTEKRTKKTYRLLKIDWKRNYQWKLASQWTWKNMNNKRRANTKRSIIIPILEPTPPSHKMKTKKNLPNPSSNQMNQATIKMTREGVRIIWSSINKWSGTEFIKKYGMMSRRSTSRVSKLTCDSKSTKITSRACLSSKRTARTKNS